MQTDSNKHKIDWMLLLFLVGATYVKLYVKIPVIVLYLAYVIYKRYKFPKLESIHWFYVLMPLAGLLGAYLHHSFSDQNYLLAFGMGVAYWLLGGTISYLLYISVKSLPLSRIHQTVKGFFALNALYSAFQLVGMIIASGHLVPYWYWGPDSYYGGATGDHLLGITGNISVTNAMITALGSIYFIFTKDVKWAILCIITSILCTSNLTLLILLIVLLGVIILVKSKDIRKYTIFTFITALIIYPILTLDNIKYMETIYTEDIKYKEYTAGELATIESITSKAWKEYPSEKLSAKTFKRKNTNYYKVPLSDRYAMSYKSDMAYLVVFDSLKQDKKSAIVPADNIKNFIKSSYENEHQFMPLSTFHYPIKIYTYLQTLNYLMSGKRNLISGAGIGNFSSKQAIKTTGLGLQGKYPVNDIYINKAFLEYHMYSLLYVLGLPVSEHSIINMPNSIYNQIAGEYGLSGIIIFLIMYLGYFWRKRGEMKNYGYALIVLMLVFLGFDYWFEMLSLTVIFELLMFINIYKENAVEGK